MKGWTLPVRSAFAKFARAKSVVTKLGVVVLALAVLPGAAAFATLHAPAPPVALAACVAPIPENNVDISDLPPITSGMTVADLKAKVPFVNYVTTKIELRVLYDEGGAILVGNPHTSSTWDSYQVERYAPGFLKEGTGAASKFDGEDNKKMLRNAAMSGGGTFKDKGGAVAVIIKKSASGMTPTAMTFDLKQVVFTGLAALAIGFFAGWMIAKRKRVI
jgi:hypothetical protein